MQQLDECDARATAVDDFNAEEESEMSLKAGEIVMLSRAEFDEADGDWIYARRVGAKEDGFVPQPYLELVGEAVEEDAA